MANLPGRGNGKPCLSSPSGPSCGRQARKATPGEAGYLVAITADGHRAPAPLVCARLVAEEHAAGGIGADADFRGFALQQDFGSRTRDGGEQPVEAGFAGDKLESPASIGLSQFVVTLGDAQDIVDRRGPRGRNWLALDQGGENFAERIAQVDRAGQQAMGCSRISFGKAEELI